MLRLSNLADYAVVASVELARAAGRLSAAELAEATRIPAPTMAKLTGALVRAGVCSSSRGAAGGVELARPARDIALTHIIEAVDGPIALTACHHDRDENCRLSEQCRVKPHWQVVNQAVKGALDGVTLADLAADADPAAAPARDLMKEPA